MRACAFWRKPDGLFVIRPAAVEGFLAPLPVRLPGVGKVMEQTGAQDRGVPYAHTQPHRCAATAIRTRVALPASTRYRLVGVELSGSVDADTAQPDLLFAAVDAAPGA